MVEKIHIKAPSPQLGYADKVKHLGLVLASLERALQDAKTAGIPDVEMIVQSSYNLVLSNYYLRVRGEYVEKGQEPE